MQSCLVFNDRKLRPQEELLLATRALEALRALDTEEAIVRESNAYNFDLLKSIWRIRSAEIYLEEAFFDMRGYQT